MRDADVLAEASRHAGCHVYMSVPSVDEDAWAKLEPGTAPPAQRLRAVRQLRDAGIDAGVLMMPLVPGITTSRSSIERTMRAIADDWRASSSAPTSRISSRACASTSSRFSMREYPQLLDGYRRLYTGSYAPKGYVAQVKAVVHAAAAGAGLR